MRLTFPAAKTRAQLFFCGVLLFHLLPILILYVKSGPATSPDSAQYVSLARGILHDGSYGTICGQEFRPENVRMPGYPIFLAFWFLVFGENLWVIVVIQAVLYLASVVLTWKAACKTLDERVGVIFLLISSTYPFIAHSSTFILSETLCVFLTAASLFLLSYKTKASIISAGVLISMASYVRPNLIFLGLFIGGGVLVFSYFRAYKLGFLLMLVMLLGMVPWTIRNYETFGVISPLPVVQGTGLSLFIASWQGRVSTDTLVKSWNAKGELTQEAIDSGYVAQTENLKGDIAKKIGNNEKIEHLTVLDDCDSMEKKNLIEKEMRNAAIDNIKEHPESYTMNVLTNLFRMWFTTYGLKNFPSVIMVLLIGQGIILTVLAYVGAAILIKKNMGTYSPKLIIVAVMLYFSVTLCLLHTEARYTLPGRFAMLVLAAYALSVLFNSRAFFKLTQIVKGE